MTTYNKINLHPFFLLVAFLCVLTGYLKEFSFFTSLIFIHECGHACAAILLHWKLDQIVLLPFGGITKLNESDNRPIKEEFLILVAGPFFQILYYAFFRTRFPLYFTFYHYALLLVNLLPIYPLDGGKLCLLLLERFFPLKTSYQLLLRIGIFVTMIAFCYFFSHFHWFGILFTLFLLYKNRKTLKIVPILYEHFLLERLWYSYSFPRIKWIKGENENFFFRDCKHYFFYQERYHTEKEFLKKKLSIV